MTKRSMPPPFHANLFALTVARCCCHDIGGFVIVNRLVQTNLTPLHRPITPTMAAPQVEQKSAKARQSEQGDVKEEGIGLLAMPDD